MIIDAISDLHGYLPELEGGDILLLGGDYTARNTILQWKEFFNWIMKQDYYAKVFIGGNHDGIFEIFAPTYIAREICKEADKFYDESLFYLLDESIEIEGIKIYGTPWTKTFKNINPNCTAFVLENEIELGAKFSEIPEDIDILLSHGPPFGVLDHITHGNHVGSISLAQNILRVNPKYFLCGHIHEEGGKSEILEEIECFNISYVNEYYRPVHKPVRIKLK